MRAAIENAEIWCVWGNVIFVANLGPGLWGTVGGVEVLDLAKQESAKE